MRLLNSNVFNNFYIYHMFLITVLLLFTGCSSMLFNYMFKDMDLNSDGVVSFEEYKNGQTGISVKKMKTDFNYIDINRDGKITHKELVNSFERRSH